MIAWPDARYTASPIQEYMGNPFIEALPPILSDEDFISSATAYPPFSLDERSLPGSLRHHLIKRLDTFRLPTSQIIAAHQKLDVELRYGYVARDPRLLTARRAMYGEFSPMQQARQAVPNCFLITGLSGVGKSTLLESVLGIYPQVVVHHDITPGISREVQLVWLKVDCPQDAGLRGLCMAILEKIDKLLGTSYLMEWISTRNSVEGFLQAIYRITHNLHLGVLILDELQHLRAAKAGGEEKMLNFFVNLINGVGIPLVFVGTYALEGIIQNQLRNARRATGVGAIAVRRLKKADPMWRLLIEKLWRYQWVANPVPLDKEIEDKMYDCSQGIRDCVVKLFFCAQKLAIENQSECVIAATLQEVYDTWFRPLHPALDALRSGCPDDDPLFDRLLMKLDIHGGNLPANVSNKAVVSSQNTDEASDPSKRKPRDPATCERASEIPVLTSVPTSPDSDLRTLSGDAYAELHARKLIDHCTATLFPS